MTKQERLNEAERLAAYWLWRGNQARERGELEKAERHYANGQKWHDQMNNLLDRGDGCNDMLADGKWGA